MTGETPASGVNKMPTGAPRRYLPYLSLALLALVAIFLYLLPSVAEFRAPVQQWRLARILQQRQQRRSQQMRAGDPDIGEQLAASSPAITAALSAEPRAGRNAVIFVGPCAACVANDLREWERVQQLHGDTGVVIVSRDTPERIDAFIRDNDFRLPIVPDPDGSLAQTFNALWIPRAYGLSPDGQLIWIQKDDASMPSRILAGISAAQIGDPQ